MIRSLFFILLLFICCVNQSKAQDKIVQGKINSQNNEPIEGATIVIKDLANEESSIISYAISNKNGKYKLEFESELKSLQIKIAHINYRDYIDTIAIEKQVINYDFTLKEEVFELEGVVIAATKIRDTMNIPTDSLKLTERSTLRDILNKTDGFVVSENGGITFRGRKINKVLINEKEVFVNQNKIALDNLDFGIMEDLELINNYRDKFEVDFNNFTSSVINVNTKEEFKGVVKLYGDGAYGTEENRYLAKLRGLYFSDNLNAFLTSNTNSIGDKEFTFKDVSLSFKNNSSEFFRQNFTPFFDEDDLLTDVFDSNTSLTLRKETKRTRFGLVSYYNNANNQKNIFQDTGTDVGQIVKTEENISSFDGYSLLNSLLINHVISPKSIITLGVDQALSRSNVNNQNNILNFNPTGNVNIQEENNQDSQFFLLSSKLDFRSKLSKKLIFTSQFQFDLEKSESDFNSQFIISNPNEIQQTFDFEDYNYDLKAELDYQFNNSVSLSAGLSSKFFNENLRYDIVNEDSRDGQVSEVKLQLRGQKRKWDYKFELAPQIFNFNSGTSGNLENEQNNQNELRYNGELNYKINQNNSINATLSKDNGLIDLYRNIDTLIIGFNNRLINTNSITRVVSTNTSAKLGYNYSSIIKTQSFRATYTYSEQENYLEPIFDSIVNNVFFTRNRLLDSRNSSSLDLTASKGLYVTRRNHLIRLSSSYSYNKVNYPTFINDLEVPFEIQNNTISGTLGLELKKSFIDEISFKVRNINQRFRSGNFEVSDRNFLTYSTEISKRTDKFEFNIELGQNIQSSEGFNFDFPFLNLNATIALTDKMDVFIRGKYLLHLFDFPNTDFSSLNVVSDGNFNNRTFNRNNINYIITGISYKL